MNKALLKEKSIEVVKIIAFVLVFFLIVQILSSTVFTENSALKYNNNKKDAYSFINEKDNSIQIVGIGNSDVYSGFVPLELWREYGYTSVVSASIHQTIPESHKILEMLFEKQSPRLVIIESDMFYDGEDIDKKELKKQDWLSDFFDHMEPEFFAHNIENVFSVFRFHNYWQGGKENNDAAPYNSHGYRYNTRTCKLEKSEYMIPTSEKDDMSNLNKQQTDELINYCKSHGAEVMILTLPSINTWNYERHNAVEQFANERNLPFVDLNLHYDDMGISMTSCFRDEGNHLNYDGAKAVTLFLGDYFKRNYSFEDLRSNSDYVSWNKDLEKFDKYKNSTKKSEE
ncbi:MAG: SGNH/GDSL hydrolase family protein [Eubacterium sp.]|nr:SGNH/GDSL hydrolase family protein [Eubacterium sp.]